MTVLQSEIAVGSEQYQQNREALLAQIAEVKAVQNKNIEKSYAAKPKFDKKGNVLKDSSGNDIKVPKYVNARATIREINQEKEAIMDVQLTFFNKTNGKIIKQVPLQEKTSFANCAVSFEGDKRAIPSNWNLRIGGYLQDFPQDVLMVDQLLKQIAKRSINKMQELESQL